MAMSLPEGWRAPMQARPCLAEIMATLKMPMTTSDASANRTMQPSLCKSSCWGFVTPARGCVHAFLPHDAHAGGPLLAAVYAEALQNRAAAVSSTAHLARCRSEILAQPRVA